MATRPSKISLLSQSAIVLLCKVTPIAFGFEDDTSKDGTRAAHALTLLSSMKLELKCIAVADAIVEATKALAPLAADSGDDIGPSAVVEKEEEDVEADAVSRMVDEEDDDDGTSAIVPSGFDETSESDFSGRTNFGTKGADEPEVKADAEKDESVACVGVVACCCCCCFSFSFSI